MSAGIIGGADGPTEIFVTGGWPVAVIIGLVVIALLGIVLWKRRRK